MQHAGCIANFKILLKSLLGTFQLMAGDKHIQRISQACDSKCSFGECYPFPLTKRKVLLRYGSELLQMQRLKTKKSIIIVWNSYAG